MKTSHRAHALLCACLCLILAGCLHLPANFCSPTIEHALVSTQPPEVWQASPPVSDCLLRVLVPDNAADRVERQRLLAAISQAESLTFPQAGSPDLRDRWRESLLVKLGRLHDSDSLFRDSRCSDRQEVLRFALAAAYEAHLDHCPQSSLLCEATLKAAREHGGIEGHDYWRLVCGSIEASTRSRSRRA